MTENSKRINAKEAARIGFRFSDDFDLALQVFDLIPNPTPLTEKAFFFCSGVAESGKSFDQAWKLFTDWKRSGENSERMEANWNKKANRE